MADTSHNNELAAVYKVLEINPSSSNQLCAWPEKEAPRYSINIDQINMMYFELFFNTFILFPFIAMLNQNVLDLLIFTIYIVSKVLVL